MYVHTVLYVQLQILHPRQTQRTSCTKVASQSHILRWFYLGRHILMEQFGLALDVNVTQT